MINALTTLNDIPQLEWAGDFSFEFINLIHNTMKQFNLTNNDSFTVFIPKEVLNNNPYYGTLGTWSIINGDNENWLDDEHWCSHVNTITKLTDDIVSVIFNRTYLDGRSEVHSVAIYRGELY